jgi:hypothetical protein
VIVQLPLISKKELEALVCEAWEHAAPATKRAARKTR